VSPSEIAFEDLTPVRYFIPTPVPSPGATGQAGQAR